MFFIFIFIFYFLFFFGGGGGVLWQSHSPVRDKRKKLNKFAILSQHAIFFFCRKVFNISNVVYCTEFNFKATNNFDYLTTNNTLCSVWLACHFQVLKKYMIWSIYRFFYLARID